MVLTDKYMGSFKIEDQYSIGKTKILIIAQEAEQVRYIGVFEYEDKLYTVYNISDLSELKGLIESFSLK